MFPAALEAQLKGLRHISKALSNSAGWKQNLLPSLQPLLRAGCINSSEAD